MIILLGLPNTDSWWKVPRPLLCLKCSQFSWIGDFEWAALRVWEAKIPGGSVVKNPPVNTGDPDLIPGSGRFPVEGSGDPLQYSFLGNPTARGAWRATIHGVTKESDTTYWLKQQLALQEDLGSLPGAFQRVERLGQAKEGPGGVSRARRSRRLLNASSARKPGSRIAGPGRARGYYPFSQISSPSLRSSCGWEANRKWKTAGLHPAERTSFSALRWVASSGPFLSDGLVGAGSRCGEPIRDFKEARRSWDSAHRTHSPRETSLCPEGSVCPEKVSASALGSLGQRFPGTLPELQTHLAAEKHRWEGGDVRGPRRQRFPARSPVPAPPPKERFASLPRLPPSSQPH